MSSDIHINSYICPTCFLIWTEDSQLQDDTKFKNCFFCSEDLTSYEILMRQIDVMPNAPPCYFPDVIRRLISHLELKKF